jgi:glycosyltransferase involved in cell wall biosynthesis
VSEEAATDGLVSAIIPVYNGDRFLAEAIESVLDQTYLPIEVIVVDDGSTDDSAAVARGFTGVTVIGQENEGVAVARNTGIESASGQFLAFLDADDQWAPEKTALQVEYLRDNPGCDYVLCRYQNYFPMGVPAWFRRKEADDSGQTPVPSALLCRFGLFTAVGRFAPEYRHGEDTEWFARVRDYNAVGHTLREVLMHRRIHDRNLTGDVERGRKSLFRLLRASVERKQAASDKKGR